MANPVWPAGLPQIAERGGYGETPPDLVVRSEMDVGEDQIRGRATDGPRNMSLVFAMDVDEVEIFDQFFVITTKGGSLPYDWVHPRTGASKTFQFRSLPNYINVGGADWRVSFLAEVLV